MFGYSIAGFPTLDDFASATKSSGVDLAIFCRLGRQASDMEYTKSDVFRELSNRYPMVVLSDVESPTLVMAALDAGFKGYLTTALSLELAADALKLVRSGGTFIPANCLKRALDNESYKTRSLFTAKQQAVVEALRKGKANKIIAYELNMCESTVKVHIRNIMKKLRAKNRTEVAYLANDLENREKY